MKTLDEVIAELTTIYDRYEAEGCFYCSFQRECYGGYCYLADALHYLKVLQKMQKAQPVTKGEWDELYNNPLTWSELKQMDEKPVWVEVYHGERAWFLVFVDPDDDEKIFGIDAYGAKRQFNKNLWTNRAVKGYRNGRQ